MNYQSSNTSYSTSSLTNDALINYLSNSSFKIDLEGWPAAVAVIAICTTVLCVKIYA